MSNQNDLVTEYRKVSNEQPSEQVDEFILKAAADALQDTASDENQSNTNVITGRFSTRRWHMPVSIAAAAVITVSVVTSLEPWQVSIPTYAPTPSEAVEIESDEKVSEKLISEARLEPASEKLSEFDTGSITDSIASSEAKIETRSTVAAKITSREAKTDLAANKKQLSNKQEVLRMRAAPALQKAKARAAEAAEQELAGVLVSEKNQLIGSNDYIQADTTKINESVLDRAQLLTIIEDDIKNNKLETASEKLKDLLKQYPMESFSENELIRLRKVQQTLKGFSNQQK